MSKSPPEVHLRRAMFVYDLDAWLNGHHDALDERGPDNGKREEEEGFKRGVFGTHRFDDTREERSIDS